MSKNHALDLRVDTRRATRAARRVESGLVNEAVYVRRSDRTENPASKQLKGIKSTRLAGVVVEQHGAT